VLTEKDRKAPLYIVVAPALLLNLGIVGCAQPRSAPAVAAPAAAPAPVKVEQAPPEPPPPPPGPVAASPEVYTVVAESEAARLLLATWAPGQGDAMHSHPEYVMYALTDMNWQGTQLDGSEVGGTVGAGQVLTPSGTLAGHSTRNAGESEAKMLILERKTGAVQSVPEGSAPASVEASPKQYQVLAETPWVRVVKASWGPGERDTMHSHPEVFVYAFADANWRVRTAAGEQTRLSMTAGQAQHQPPDAGHSIKNIGKQPASVLIFEMK